MRMLQPTELSAVRSLVTAIGDDALRSQALVDLAASQVHDVAPGRYVFDIPGFVRDVYHGQRAFFGADGFPVEGKMHDGDGAAIDVYLFASDGRLLELELLRHDGEPIKAPDWNSFYLV